MASAKIGRLVTICAAFKLPILNFVDCPGFAIGTRAEKEGTIRAGSRLACVMFESKIPYFTVLARKCFGVAGSILANPGQGNTELSAGVDFRVGWPMIEAGSLPIEGGIEAAFKGELAAIGDPVARAARKEQIDREIRQFMSPQRTAEVGC
jgi:acetyl-CoA carboxylase carboxyltransferase component